MNRRALLALAALAAGATSSEAELQDQAVPQEAIEELTQLSLAYARIAAARDTLDAVPGSIDVAPDEHSRRWNEEIDAVDRDLEELEAQIGARAEEIQESLGVEGA